MRCIDSYATCEIPRPMYTEQIIILREICNGIMFLSAVLVMTIVFVTYVVRQYNRGEWLGVDGKPVDHWYQDIAVQAAGAFIVLMIGHAIRAGSSWAEFFWLRHGWGFGGWVDLLAIFIAATGFTLAGKLLVTFAFTKRRWGWWLVFFVGGMSISIPLLVSRF